MEAPKANQMDQIDAETIEPNLADQGMCFFCNWLVTDLLRRLLD